MEAIGIKESVVKIIRELPPMVIHGMNLLPLPMLTLSTMPPISGSCIASPTFPTMIIQAQSFSYRPPYWG